MAEYSNLSATINAQIRANGVQAITGPVLNAVLTAMVNVLGDGYRLNGVAVPADNPGSPDNRVAYLAAQDGTYTNFGGLTISGEVALLLWDSAWTKETLFSIDTAVTPGSGNLVTSGAVDDALTTLANNIAAAYMQLVPAATEGNLAEFDNAGQVRDAGIATTNLATKDGHYPDLFAGFAGNLVDTRSAGTRQQFAFRQSGGDGVNYMRKILGRTEAWNQLVGPSDTQVTIPSGHLYYAIINGTASVGTSDGTPISVTGGSDIVVDLTLEGLGLTTADQFRALHPLGYYNYNAGVLKNNAATGLETTGKNIFDKQWDLGYWDASGWHSNSNFLGCKNRLPVLPNTAYYWKCPTNVREVEFWDAANNYLGRTSYGEGVANTTFTTPADCTSITFYFGGSYGSVYKFDTCINISNADFNGTYEPYWKRDIVLGVTGVTGIPEGGTEADRVTVFPNGLAGVGTAQDMFYEENGVAKAIKVMGSVDLGTLNWTYASQYNNFTSTTAPAGIKGVNYSTKANAVCSKYIVASGSTIVVESLILNDSGTVLIKTTAYTDAATFKAAMDGVYLEYELATPIVYTDLQNADGTPFVFPKMAEVDSLGTEKRLPEDTADNPQAPFECDSNYSVSTANLVRLLNL